ncbi:hypothetical protein [Pollutimonas harenae]|uniref:Uncharacterized protein n=1 Tax=Pollutimonas harenae TaxID=657015 RepID=A0A853HA53_9BURK|nr:hypothetical protein [Pollutimonas harenae]NYT86904.1 hypothetical protein [Pollutimonas harenae]TEA69382.1 hypothetical protein ERD84_15125 [Pollutimonas harenae]
MSLSVRLPHSPRAYAGMSIALLALAIAFNTVLTRSMALHMLVHIPLILFAGICADVALCSSQGTRSEFWKRGARAWAQYNEQGIPGLLWGTLFAAYWMIPKSLDDVLLIPILALVKYAGLFFTGMVLFDSLRRANSVVKLFFLGNFSWMMAIVGLIYQDQTSRLCNAYLLSDQEMTGKGLVVLAVAVPIVWLLTERSRFLRLMSK